MEVGNLVAFINETLSGEIISIQGKYAIVFCDDGFEREAAITELAVIHRDSHKKLKASKPTIKNSDKINAATGKPLPVKVKEDHIDLHIEELLESTRNMTNGEILMHQIRKFEERLKRAQNNQFDRLVAVHGVGEGVLRAEIHRLLIRKYELEFMDAPYQEYGYGATLIFLKKRP